MVSHEGITLELPDEKQSPVIKVDLDKCKQSYAERTAMVSNQINKIRSMESQYPTSINNYSLPS